MFFKADLHLLMFVALFIRTSYGQQSNNNRKPVYEVMQSWNDTKILGFQGKIEFNVGRNIPRGWKLRLQFHGKLDHFECWNGKVESAHAYTTTSEYIVTNVSHNGILKQGDNIMIGFNGKIELGKDSSGPPPLQIRFQGRLIYRSPELIATTSTVPPSVSTTDFIYVLNSLTVSNRVLTTSQQNNNDRRDNADQNENVEENNESRNEDIQSVHLTNEDINRRNEDINRRNDLLNQQNSTENPQEGSGAGETIEPSSRPPSFSTLKPSSTTTNTRTMSTTTVKPTTRSRPAPVRVVTKYDYVKVLHKSLLFYEAQRSGRLPADRRLSWTRDSGLQDQGDYGEDLTGGFYDAGDYVKFGFPMAFSVTVLAWGVIEYWDVYEATGELQYALNTLRWGADYFMKAHVSKFELYGQVGDAEKEHKKWGRFDDMRIRRPAFKITKNSPGSDLAGETSAALSAVAVAVRKSENGVRTPYVNELIRHANELYDFAKNFGRHYHISIPNAKDFYKSTNYKDEITWAAAWLYRATGDKAMLDQAEGQYQNWVHFRLPKSLSFSWDDKTVGIQMLLGQISDVYKRRYHTHIGTYCEAIRPPITKANYTRKGLIYLAEWSPLRYAANAAFICLMAADSGVKADENRNWAKSQIHYMLGDGGRSYVIGFGRNYPKQPHHRASSCPPRPQQCGWNQFEANRPNPITLHGGLVGGPDLRDRYQDKRSIIKQSEVALDYNAGFQGAIVALQHLAMFPNVEIDRTQEPWYKNVKKNSEDGSTDGPESGSDLIRMCWIRTVLASLMTSLLIIIVLT